MHNSKNKMGMFLVLVLIFWGSGAFNGGIGKYNPKGKELSRGSALLAAQNELNTGKGGKLVGPGLIEAEHCRRNGEWKVWDLPKFSGGQCINNEDSDHLGQPASSSYLSLNFQGTGVSIIYRQDTWYGSLSVEIDEKIVGTINQKGPVKNQVESYFKAGAIGPHSLVLIGSKATGVITVDAIRVIGD